MKIITGILEHTTIIIILLIIFSQNYIRIRYFKDYDLIDKIITNLTINLATFTLCNYMLSFIGVGTKYIYQGAITLIIILSLNNLIKNHKIEQLGIINTRIKKTLILLSPVIFISIWQFLPTLTLLNSSASSLNMTSVGNNDIANYALTAKEYLFSGFTNSGHYPDVDLNMQARDVQHLTVHLMTSFTSFVFKLEVWKVMNSVMIFTILLNAIALTKLFQICFKRNSTVFAFITVSVALLNPLNTYIIHHYFLSQSLALFVFSLIIMKAYAIYDKEELNKIDKIEIIAIVVLSVLTYPSILIPSVIGLFFVNIILELINKKRNDKILKLKYINVMLYALVGILLSIYYLPRAFLILYRHATIQSGWELPAPNLVGVLLSPFYIQNEVSNLASVIIWLALNMVILYICILNVKSKKSSNYFISIAYLIVFVYLLQVMVRGQGFGHYQNWKLLSYIFPILIIIFASEILKLKNVGIILLTPLLIAGLNAPRSIWKNGNEVGNPSIISRDLIDLKTIKDEYGIDSLNVLLEPYYQTMVVGLVTDMKRIYFSSPTYYPISLDEKSCGLVKNSDIRFSNKTQINKTYSLISSNDLECDLVNKDNIFTLRNYVEYMFAESNSENRKILDRGWSYTEEWGTWSEGNYSRIRFNLERDHSPEGTLEFKYNIFVPEESNQVDIMISLNGINLGDISLNSNQNLLELQVDNLRVLDNILEFKYSNIKSPAELKISEDRRLIAFGIKSIMIRHSRN